VNAWSLAIDNLLAPPPPPPVEEPIESDRERLARKRAETNAKWCPKCEADRPLAAFYVLTDPRCHAGWRYSSWCRACTAEKDQQRPPRRRCRGKVGAG
jgi:hypothetical protein